MGRETPIKEFFNRASPYGKGEGEACVPKGEEAHIANQAGQIRCQETEQQRDNPHGKNPAKGFHGMPPDWFL